MKYLLKTRIDGIGKAKSTLEFDPEWNEWFCPEGIYNFRGSIGEGELAMLLNYLVDSKSTTILEKVT